ncbi:hypothetical protein ACFW9N_39905 [Streptomyces sp. NPDC059496]|uniref:hypothetical protein n=1 Tax=Streptomyces sp. NPDC059496 TaxID=3346851 RepID=UPI0036C9AF65
MPAGAFEGTTFIGSFDAERLDRIAKVHGFPSVETPAPVDDNSALRTVYTRSGGGPYGNETSRWDPHGLPGGLLLHAAFDGSKWTTLEDPKQDAKPLFSRRGAAIASYHGKLHADCPHPMHDDLLHATWTKASGWTKPVRSTPGPPARSRRSGRGRGRESTVSRSANSSSHSATRRGRSSVGSVQDCGTHPTSFIALTPPSSRPQWWGHLRR